MELFRLFGTIALNDNGGVQNQLNSIDNRASGVGETFGKMAKKVAAAGTIIATALGTMVYKSSDNLQKSLNGLQASTGASTEEMAELRDTMEAIYNNNFGENFDDIGRSIATVKQNTGLAGKELQTMTEGAIALRNTFEFEVNESTRTAQSLMKQFGIDGREAYDLIAYSAQHGANKNGDLLDTLNEYAPQFQAMGFSAQQFAETLVEGAENGTWSIDKVGDAMKEFNVRSKDGSKTTTEAFKALGLDANKLSKDFAKGGEQGQKAFALVTEKLNNVKDPLKKGQIGVALFGTQFEDLEAKGIEALTQISDKGVDAKGTLEQINQVKYNSFGEALAGIGRFLISSFITPLGDKLLPKLSEFSEWFKQNLPQIEATSKTIVDGIVQLFDDFSNAIVWVKDNADILIPIISGLVATIGSLQIISTVKGLMDLWTASTFAQTLAQEGLNVALTSNPIGAVILIIGLLVAAGVALYMHWDKVKAFAGQLWEYLKSKFKAIGDFISKVFGNVKQGSTQLTDWLKSKFKAIGDFISKTWETLKQKTSQAWNWIKSNLSTVISAIKNVIVSPIASVVSFVINNFGKIKSSTSSIFSSIKDTILKYITNAKNIIRNTIASIKNTWTTVFSYMTYTVAKKFNEIVSTIKRTLSNAWSYITGIVTKIKNKLASMFDFKFPHIKLPKFVLEMSSKTILGKTISYPSGFKVKWNADGGILTKPTIFGMMGNGTLLGGGEAGHEAILPISKLDGLMASAIKKADANTKTSTGKVINQTNNFYSPKALDQAEMSRLMKRENQKLKIALSMEV